MKDEKALVSLIVPVYNVEKYLDKCVQSIVDQTYTNMEIILVDDGSSDNCPQMCDIWAAKDKRIIVIHKENAGVGRARNTAMDVASGEYWMFVDSDDYISRYAVELLMNRILADGSDMAAGRFIDVYNDGRMEEYACSWMENTVITKEEALLKMGEKYDLPAMMPGKIYSNKLFKDLRFPSLKHGEDLWIFMSIFDRCQYISIVDSPVYFYYQRNNSVTHNKSEDSQIDVVYANLYAARFLFERGFQNSARRRYFFAICEALWLKDKGVARRMMAEQFNVEERRLMMKSASLDARLRWVCLYMSIPVTMLKILKTVKSKFG